VIPFTPTLYSAPLFVEVEFPERAGALLAFMQEVSASASLCYFTYSYSGERVGRALLGLDYATEAERDDGRNHLDAAASKTVRSLREVELSIFQ